MNIIPCILISIALILGFIIFPLFLSRNINNPIETSVILITIFVILMIMFVVLYGVYIEHIL